MKYSKKLSPLVATLSLFCLTTLTHLSHAQSVGSGGGQGCPKTQARDPEAAAVDPNKQLMNIMKMATKIEHFMKEGHYRVALVSRAGSNNSDREFRNPTNQKYSHTGIIVPDGKGSWKFVHLLDTCSGPISDIYDQGLGQFFSDDPYMYDFTISVPSEELQQKIETLINDRSVGEKGWAKELHWEKYSNIAYPFSLAYQNSNMWVLTVLAAAQADVKTRAEAQNVYTERGFQPSRVKMKGIEKLGAAFHIGMPSNVKLDAHPIRERISGWLSFVSSESVYQYLRQTDHPLVDRQEICHDAGCNIPASDLNR